MKYRDKILSGRVGSEVEHAFSAVSAHSLKILHPTKNLKLVIGNFFYFASFV